MGKENKDFYGLSPEFQVLGKEFNEIGARNGLDEAGIKILDQIFVEWLKVLGKTEEKIQIVENLLRDYPYRKGVIKSLTEVTLAYLEKAPSSPLGKFAKKAKDN